MNSSQLSWEKVEKYLSEKTKSASLLAIIETEKIFQKVLENLNFPGKTLEQKIKALKFVLSDYQHFLAAHKIYKRLVSELNFELEENEIKEVLSCYYKTIEEIINFQNKKQGFLLKLKIKLISYLPTNIKKFFKKISLIIILFFFIIFILDSTKIGRKLVSIFVAISHFIFSWVLMIILLLFILAIIVIGILLYLEHRKKTKIIKIN